MKAATNAWLRWVRVAFAAAAAVGVAVYLARNWEQLVPLLHTRDPGASVLAAGLFALTHIVIAFAYHALHRALGVHKTAWQSLDSYLLRLPARYIPGGVWHAGARYLDIHAAGAARTSGLARVFVAENGVVAVTGMALAALLASGAGSATLQPAAWLAAAGCVLGLALLLAARRFTRTPVQWPALAVGALLLFANWLIVSFAFALYAGALEPLAACAKPTLAAGYSVAAVSGFLVIFAPQGWGVGEATFALLRPCELAPAGAVAIFAGFRLLMALADFVLFVGWAVLRRWRRARD